MSRPYSWLVNVRNDGGKVHISIKVSLLEILPRPTQEELNELFLQILECGIANPNAWQENRPWISLSERVAGTCGYLEGRLEPAGDIPLKRG
jgi:hypothetical protein